VIRCTTARVDLAALESNFTAIASYLAGEAGLNRAAGHGPAMAPGIIAVVKANAYGHRARCVAPALEGAGEPAVQRAARVVRSGVEDARRRDVDSREVHDECHNAD
jgi:alanine racemase